jgi:hypothetical protein
MSGAPRFGRGRTSFEPRDGAGNDNESSGTGTGSGKSGKYEEALPRRRGCLLELNDERTLGVRTQNEVCGLRDIRSV